MTQTGRATATTTVTNAVAGYERRRISGWGRTAGIVAEVGTPDSFAAVSEMVAAADLIVARGLGRSYGDAAQTSGGLVVDMTRLDRVVSFDPATGITEVEAGTSLDHLMEVFLPQGWFVPVTPGTRFVTVGGAIASDIHGKNHHADGSFGNHVVDFDIVTGDGTTHTVSPSTEPDLFWATVGGMGLTGIVTRARIRLQSVETSLLLAVTERANNLDALMTKMATIDAKARYSVAWVDCLAKGSAFGRGLLTYGGHATAAQVPRDRDKDLFERPPTIQVPVNFPRQSLNRLSVKVFNELWFRKVPKDAKPTLQTVPQFFHPLDFVGQWNRIYGAPGFIQYQFVVPDGNEELVRRAIRDIAAIGGASFLAVLKRFGETNDAPLSFPIKGWTLALDLPANLPGLGHLLDRLDEAVLVAGGRIYLSKDSRVRPAMIPQMYPRLPRWQQVREQFDPERKFQSDLARRLGL